jgi:hypothetical protein
MAKAENEYTEGKNTEPQKGPVSLHQEIKE